MDRGFRRRRIQSRRSDVAEMGLGCQTMPGLKDRYVPVPPVAAFVVGFVLYVAFSVVGLAHGSCAMPAITASVDRRGTP